MTHRPGTIILHSRRYVDPFRLKLEEIDMLDISHALAHKCRYQGHCPKFYSVAEHSVEVSYWLARQGFDAMTQLCGLLHDAAETYLPDIPGPIKGRKEFWPLNDCEDKIMQQVINRFELDDSQETWDDVLLADIDLLRSECVSLWGCQPSDWGLALPTDYISIGGVRPRDARVLFEQRFHELQVAIKEAV